MCIVINYNNISMLKKVGQNRLLSTVKDRQHCEPIDGTSMLKFSGTN